MISGIKGKNQAYIIFKKENWRKRKVLDIAVCTADSLWEEMLWGRSVLTVLSENSVD